MIAPMLVCHYCGEPCDWHATSDHVYRRDYGPIWQCAPCYAWVGCHINGEGPHKHSKGTPANAEDRALRKAAHAAFDPLWARVAERDSISKGRARKRAYAWLAGALGIEPHACHIAMMHGDQLRRVVDCCTPPFGTLTTTP